MSTSADKSPAHRVERRVAETAMLVAALFSVSACFLPPAATPPPLGPRTAAFLDAADFTGTFDPRKSDTTYGGQAVYFGRIIFTNLARNIVESVLDAMPSSDLQLAQNNSATPNLHPVVLFIGDQTQGSFVLPPGWQAPFPVGSTYHELILLIPFVQKKGSLKWHNYVVRIFLDDYWAMWVGNVYYGLNKEQALLLDTTASYDVFRKVDHMFHAVFTTSQPWLPEVQAEAQLANYQDAQKILEMPTLGTIAYFPGKPYVCSYFEFHYEKGEARAVASKHEFLKEFDAGMSAWQSAGTLASVPDGAFEIRQVRWRMGFPPLACQF